MYGRGARTRALLAAVAREGNVAAAARAVGMDASNARRHLRAAEERAGARLVELRRGGSDGRNARLTAAGRRLVAGGALTGTALRYLEDDGLTELRVGARALFAAGRHAPGLVAVEVDPAAVAVARGTAAATSVRNQLAMTVAAIEPREEGTYALRLVAGELGLDALVVKASLRELRLKKGSRVVAAVKATAVKVTPLGGGD